MQDDEREWQAFRYALGELPAGETAPFERQLATDQETRELLARMVALAAGLHAAESSCEHNAARQDRRPEPIPAERLRRWAMVAAAVCASVAVGLHVLPTRDVRRQDANLQETYAARITENTRITENNSAGRLVAIWSERLTESADEAGVTASMHSERFEEAAAGSLAVSDQIGFDEFEVPGWMIAAVSLDEPWNPNSSTRPTEN